MVAVGPRHRPPRRARRGGGRPIKTLRLPVLAAAQPFAWRQAQQRFMRRRAVFALLAFAAALAAYVWGESLYSGFAVIAGLLLGAALLLPVLLAGALRLGETCASAPLAQWFWADSRQQLPGLSLALTALLLALATNVGVGGMVEGFRADFHALAGRTAGRGSLFRSGGHGGKPSASKRGSATRPEVAAVLPAARTTIRLAGGPTQVVGMTSHETYRTHFPMLAQSADAWDEMKRGDGVLVSEQFARRLDLASARARIFHRRARSGAQRSSAFFPITAIRRDNCGSTSMR